MRFLSLVSLVVIGVAALISYYEFVYDDFRPESIAGTRVLVTGASSGIGEEIAYFYSKHGASLAIVARREDLLKKVADRCKSLGAHKVHYVVADLALSEDRVRVVRAAKTHMGGLDHLIVNHALMTAFLWQGSAKNMTTLQRQMNVNFFSYVHLVSLSLDMLKESKGNVGIVSAGAARLSFLMAATYSATKFALDGFFVGYREELKLTQTGITVSIAYVGYVATEKAMSIVHGAFPSHVDDIPAPSSVADCAAAIVRGVAARKREILFPFSMRIAFFAQSIAPSYLVSLISSVQYAWLD